jgi:hypothetical protein
LPRGAADFDASTHACAEAADGLKPSRAVRRDRLLQRALLLFFVLVFVIAWFPDRLGRVFRVEFHNTSSPGRGSPARGGARLELSGDNGLGSSRVKTTLSQNWPAVLRRGRAPCYGPSRITDARFIMCLAFVARSYTRGATARLVHRLFSVGGPWWSQCRSEDT